MSARVNVWGRVNVRGVTTDVLDVLCVQLTRDLFVIAKFMY